jgi:tRNA (adenine57-N1/adenine58-N1)-methyltransferase
VAEPEAAPDAASAVPSGVRIGPFVAGERITLTDNKNRRHSVVLAVGGRFHTTKGAVDHDELIGQPEGVVVTSVGGTSYLALRPLLNEYTVTMPRGAQVIYPKDAAQIAMSADIFPGARVVEAGVGSGALTCTLLRAIGPTGRLTSYERRDDFAAQARKNVDSFFGMPLPTWDLVVGDLVESIGDGPVDRVILDMLAPWECVEALARVLVPGAVFCAYVATTTQLARTVETLRVQGGFTEPEATETLIRAWHAEGLAVRPRHDMVGHTGFVVTARRLAPGVTAPPRKRRPAPGAYGEDYTGPRGERG